MSSTLNNFTVLQFTESLLMAQLEKNGLSCYFFITKSSGWKSGKAGCDSFQINFLKNNCCDTGCDQVQPPVVGIWQSWNSDLQASTLG